jgi:hypothetical protein
VETRVRLINSNGSISFEVTDPDEVRRLIAEGWVVTKASAADLSDPNTRTSKALKRETRSKVMQRSDLEKLDAKEKMAFFKAGGILVDR